MQQSHTYRIRTSQRTDQKCGKSVPASTQEEMRSIREHHRIETMCKQFQNFSPPLLEKKIKTRNRTNRHKQTKK